MTGLSSGVLGDEMGLDKTLETLARRAMCNEKADGSNFETLGPIAIAMDTVTADEISPAVVEARARKSSTTTDKMPMIIQYWKEQSWSSLLFYSTLGVSWESQYRMPSGSL